MKTKVLIFPKNNPIGLISSPQKGSLYTDVLRFNDDKIISDPLGLQYQYINKFFMNNGDDWLLKLNSQKNRKWSISSPTTANFTVSQDDYDYSFQELKNADFAVIQITDNKNNVFYEFYEISFVSKDFSGLLEFEATLDIFFTYQPFKTKEGVKNFVERGHKKRFNYDNNKLKPILKNFVKSEDLKFSPIQINTEKLQNKYLKFDGGYLNLDDKIGNVKYGDILKTIKYAVFYVSSNKEEFNYKINGPESGSFFDYTVNGLRETYTPNLLSTEQIMQETQYKLKSLNSLPYGIIIMPFSFKYGLFLYSFNGSEISQQIPNSFYESFLWFLNETNNFKSKSISCQIYDDMPTNFFRYRIFGTDESEIQINVVNNNSLNRWESVDIIVPEYAKYWNDFRLIGNNNFAFGYNIKYLNLASNDGKNFQFESDKNEYDFLKDWHSFWENTKPNIDDNISKFAEPKILSSQFFKYKIHNYFSSKEFTFLDFNTDTGNQILGNFNFTPEEYNIMYFFKNSNLVNNGYLFQNGNIFNVFGTFEAPLKTDIYDNYINQNRSKIAEGKYTFASQADQGNIKSEYINTPVFGNPTVSQFTGIFQKIGKMTKEFFGAGTGATRKQEADFLKTSSSHNLRFLNATLQDLKNIPANISPASNKYMSSYLNGFDESGLFLSTISLNSDDENSVLNFFIQFGYSIQQLINLTEFIKSRYYFNYVIAFDIFTTLEPTKNLSTEIKKVISTSYAEGLRIWHIRDLTTFKGVHNYDYENWEVDLINETNNNK